MEPLFTVKDFRNLYRVLYFIEQKKGELIGGSYTCYTFNSLDCYIGGFMAAATPDQLETETCPNFYEFDKWLKGHLTNDVDISLNWHAQILKRNGNDDEKAFVDFFKLLRIFKSSTYTTKTLIVDAATRSYGINRWVEKNGEVHPEDTFYQEVVKIRWSQLSNSTGIWIDFLDKNNNILDGAWYLNEQKANEALLDDFGHFENNWFNENISNN